MEKETGNPGGCLSGAAAARHSGRCALPDPLLWSSCATMMINILFGESRIANQASLTKNVKNILDTNTNRKNITARGDNRVRAKLKVKNTLMEDI